MPLIAYAFELNEGVRFSKEELEKKCTDLVKELYWLPVMTHHYDKIKTVGVMAGEQHILISIDTKVEVFSHDLNKPLESALVLDLSIESAMHIVGLRDHCQPCRDQTQSLFDKKETELSQFKGYLKLEKHKGHALAGFRVRYRLKRLGSGDLHARKDFQENLAIRICNKLNFGKKVLSAGGVDIPFFPVLVGDCTERSFELKLLYNGGLNQFKGFPSDDLNTLLTSDYHIREDLKLFDPEPNCHFTGNLNKILSDAYLRSYNQSALERLEIPLDSVPEKYVCHISDKLMDVATSHLGCSVDFDSLYFCDLTDGLDPYQRQPIVLSEKVIDSDLTVQIMKFVADAALAHDETEDAPLTGWSSYFGRVGLEHPGRSDKGDANLNPQTLEKYHIGGSSESLSNLQVFCRVPEELSDINFRTVLESLIFAVVNDPVYKDKTLDDLQDQDGRNLLHISAIAHNRVIYQRLRMEKISEAASDRYGKTPAFYYESVHAALNGLKSVAERDALKKLEQPILEGQYDVALRRACTEKNHDKACGYVTALITHGLVSADQSGTPFDINGASPSTGMTALHYAARAGNQALYDDLIKHGADAKKKDNTGKMPSDLLKNSDASTDAAAAVSVMPRP